MAIAYVDTKTTTDITDTTITIAKPTGLAVSNLLVAHLSVFTSNGKGVTFTIPSGWARLQNQSQVWGGTNKLGIDVLHKVADSSDVAASTFTFNGLADTGGITGALSAFSGDYNHAAPFGASNHAETAVAGSPKSLDAHITPTKASSFLLGLITMDGTSNITAFSVATSNPTWTERYDVSRSGPTSATTKYTATRPETTSTGNSSITNGGLNAMCHVLASIEPTIPVTVAPTVFNIIDTLTAPTIKIKSHITATVLAIINTVVAPFNVAKWKNKNKPSTTWTDQTKN